MVVVLICIQKLVDNVLAHGASGAPFAVLVIFHLAVSEISHGVDNEHVARAAVPIDVSHLIRALCRGLLTSRLLSQLHPQYQEG